jgi:hypothetical protein
MRKVGSEHTRRAHGLLPRMARSRPRYGGQTYSIAAGVPQRIATAYSAWSEVGSELVTEGVAANKRLLRALADQSRSPERQNLPPPSQLCWSAVAVVFRFRREALLSERFWVVRPTLNRQEPPMAEISPMRRRMIEDMAVRNLSPATQQSYIYASPSSASLPRQPRANRLNEGRPRLRPATSER